MKTRLYIILLLTAFFQFSCEDFQETDLSKTKVILVSPSDNLITGNNLTAGLTTLTFCWDSIEKVKNYNLRIVSKSFQNLEVVIADTTLSKTMVNKALSVGEYEWRVLASNGYYKASSDTFKLIVKQAE